MHRCEPVAYECDDAGFEQLRERTGATTLIHPDDAAYARSQGAEVDGEVSIGEKIGPLMIVACATEQRQALAPLTGSARG